MDGESLLRPPQGYDPQHQLIEYLKRKVFVCAASLADAQLCAPDAMKTAFRHHALAAPMMDWLCGALELDF